MADKYLNQTDLQEIGDWGYDQFVQKTELEALDKKVDDIVAEGGEPNVIEKIKLNGTEQTITNKEVDIEVPILSSEQMGDTGKADTVAIENDNCGFAMTKDGMVTLLGPNGRLDHQFTLVDRDYADTTYRTEQQVQDAIDAHIGSAYKAKGSIAFANLPAPAANVEGFVYNVTDGFTTTADFVEGAGNKYPAGTDVVIINNGTDEEPEYKYNALTGVTDLSNYWTSQLGQPNTLEAMTVAEVRAILYRN